MTVIYLSERPEACRPRKADCQGERGPCEIIVLPMIRIERYANMDYVDSVCGTYGRRAPLTDC